MDTITGTELNRMNERQIVEMLARKNCGVTVHNKVQGVLCVKTDVNVASARKMFLSQFKKENKKVLRKPVIVISREGGKELFYYVKHKRGLAG